MSQHGYTCRRDEIRRKFAHDAPNETYDEQIDARRKYSTPLAASNFANKFCLNAKFLSRDAIY